jgi:poly-gamma-glutamate capsule biosynthesis protein CapA/YwtB (metallophosphatase superfamily)
MRLTTPSVRLSIALCVVVIISARAAGPAAQSPAPITITLTGQSMIRSDIRTTAPGTVPIIRELLKGDVRFTNLEAAVAARGQTTREGRAFLTPPEALDALTASGFNLLALSGTGMNVAEASAPAYLKTPKGTVALVASASGLIAAGGGATADRPGVNELRVFAGGKQNNATEDMPAGAANAPSPEDARRILQSIRDARQHADLVIVYQHNHVFGHHSFATIFTEGMPERLAPNPWLQKWTHDEIDAGADVVVMHGAPLLHGVEIYRGRPIFYDLGNFIYNLPATLTYIDEPMSWETVVAYVEFATVAQGFSPAARLRSVSFRPAVMNPIGEGQPDAHDPYADNQFLHTRGLPAPATGARAGYILERLAEASKAFGVNMSVRGETAEIVVSRQ